MHLQQRVVKYDMALNDINKFCEDILNNESFITMAGIEHHGKDNSVYTHSVRVAIEAYSLCMVFGIQCDGVHEIVRAALLHDFFCYNWRSEKIGSHVGFKRIVHAHAFVHGKIAAYNACGCFELNDKQIDAIRCHMFPLVKPPRHIDGWIVTYADKIVAIREFIKAAYLYAQNGVFSLHAYVRSIM